MQLLLKREVFSKDFTLGLLFIDGVFFCYTCEDTDRNLDSNMPVAGITKAKIYGKTAIPTGTYPVMITMSARFKKMMPLVAKVKGFEGIRIHAGNTHVDTHGCPLVGLTRTANGVGNSRAAFTKLMDKLEGVSGVTLTVTK